MLNASPNDNIGPSVFKRTDAVDRELSEQVAANAAALAAIQESINRLMLQQGLVPLPASN